MNRLKVTKVDQESIEFDNGVQLYSDHQSECCESHYLSFRDLTLDDFKGLEFNLTTESFFKKVDGYGIELIPTHGHSVKVPGYGHNNGYYSTELTLVVTNKKDFRKEFDITECQDINE